MFILVLLLLLAISCNGFNEYGDIRSVPRVSMDLIPQLKEQYDHVFLLLMSSPESTAGYDVYSDVFYRFRIAPSLFIGRIILDDDVTVQSLMKGKDIPTLKYIRSSEEGILIKTYKGKFTLDALTTYITKKTGIDYTHLLFKPSKLKAYEDVYAMLHTFTEIASRFFETEERELLLQEMEDNKTALERHMLGCEADFHEFADMHIRIMKEHISKDSSVKDIAEEVRVLKKLYNNKEGLSLSEKPLVKREIEIHRSYISSIPNIVHFIKTDHITYNFDVIHYLSVISAYHSLKPDAIYFHVGEDINNYWWSKTIPYVTVKPIENHISHIRGQWIGLAAHQSDFIRLDILYKYGGIYMDWDVLSIRSFDHLLSSEVVMGVEDQPLGYDEVIGVAVIMSRPRAQFIRRFRKLSEAKFNNDCYTCHSTQTGRDLALKHVSEVLVLNYTSFYHPGFTYNDVKLMFDPLANDNNDDNNPLDIGYAMHMFESNENFYLHAAPLMLADNLLDVDSYFGRMFKRYFSNSDRYKFTRHDGVVLGIGCEASYSITLWNMDLYELNEYNIDNNVDLVVTDYRGKRFEFLYNRVDIESGYPLVGYEFKPKDNIKMIFPLTVTITQSITKKKKNQLQFNNFIPDCVYPFRRTMKTFAI